MVGRVIEVVNALWEFVELIVFVDSELKNLPLLSMM